MYLVLYAIAVVVPLSLILWLGHKNRDEWDSTQLYREDVEWMDE